MGRGLLQDDKEAHMKQMRPAASYRSGQLRPTTAGLGRTAFAALLVAVAQCSPERTFRSVTKRVVNTCPTVTVPAKQAGRARRRR